MHLIEINSTLGARYGIIRPPNDRGSSDLSGLDGNALAEAA